jgi:hypothetical protein
MVKSCTGWNRLSVNCNKRHDLPTPVSPIIMYLNRYAYDIFVDGADMQWNLAGINVSANDRMLRVRHNGNQSRYKQIDILVGLLLNSNARACAYKAFARVHK